MKTRHWLHFTYLTLDLLFLGKISYTKPMWIHFLIFSVNRETSKKMSSSSCGKKTLIPFKSQGTCIGLSYFHLQMLSGSPPGGPCFWQKEQAAVHGDKAGNKQIEYHVHHQVFYFKKQCCSKSLCQNHSSNLNLTISERTKNARKR